ncbi:Hypp3146 [Branchiostoma lanceolatum]|uniref:Hypp3146 protein n=1 Tax=Branchiostoma lanceolatum TaxID=7740 RepID=A0A8J9ZX58_BRALA|nr:Hypp3146 [Branchiostoma lanceolatum]
MRNSDRVRTKWAQRALLQEFKEAMYAHSAYQFPKFLFHKHKGHKWSAFRASCFADSSIGPATECRYPGMCDILLEGVLLH